MSSIQSFENQPRSLVRTVHGPDGKQYIVEVRPCIEEPESESGLIYKRPEVQLYPVPSQPASTTVIDCQQDRKYKMALRIERDARIAKQGQNITLALWAGLGVLIASLILTKLMSTPAPTSAPTPVAAPSLPAPAPQTQTQQPIIIMQPAAQPAPNTIINPNCEAFCSQ